MNTTETPSTPPPLPRPRFTLEPMTGRAPLTVLETLLKHPGRILYELQRDERPALAFWLLAFALLGMAIYGVVVGTFAGGLQMLIAPAKLVLGTFLAVLICLPSLYIFTCLGGIEARLRTVAGVLFGAVCLSAVLLIGFAPVAWIFSQSTDSVAFMGTLHLLFWIIGLLFGLRLIDGIARLLGGSDRGHLKTWTVIFVVVCLQMTTTLRPIIGRSERFFPAEKQFFLAHWFESLGGTTSGK
ncbi:MAG: hypothetical protein ABIU29_11675 [Chthoniobacterales bacterium]